MAGCHNQSQIPEQLHKNTITPFACQTVIEGFQNRNSSDTPWTVTASAHENRYAMGQMPSNHYVFVRSAQQVRRPIWTVAQNPRPHSFCILYHLALISVRFTDSLKQHSWNQTLITYSKYTVFLKFWLLFTGRIFLSGYARQEASDVRPMWKTRQKTVLQASLTSVFVQFSPPCEL